MTSNQRPNVVFIMSDQHSRAVTGCYGHDIVKTPHIDRLAETGIRYDNAFCASPLCGPSRVSWITGTHPHTHGAVTHNNSRHRSGKIYRKFIEPGIHSLVADLRDAGLLGARLNDADLTTAFCKAANFFMADLPGANCTETILQEADL